MGRCYVVENDVSREVLYAGNNDREAWRRFDASPDAIFHVFEDGNEIDAEMVVK